MRAGSSQGEFNSLAEQESHFSHRVQRDGRVLGIEQAIDPRSAGLKPFGNFRLADLALIHGFPQFMSNFELDRRSPALLKHALIREKILELGTQMFSLHIGT
jgi:hypothetical protein